MKVAVPVDPELAELIQRCHGRIQEYGCVNITVPADLRKHTPCYSYTVGLMERFAQPELLVFGVPEDLALEALSELVRRFIRRNCGVPVNTPILRIVDRLPLIVMPANAVRAKAFMRLATARCKQLGRECRVQQVVWPDPSGCFPWDTAYDRRYDVLQPRLFELQ